ncbi:MAG: chemotaxis-specific protein-glutamate methyltransferase CheB [Sphingomonadaceae bacterium]|nr:chemotaxis-specific protein-glutamate methyltransferase CheB [Sphingomonadaceae bacterium]
MVVDDSLIVRTVLSRVIDPEPDMEIVAKVSSAELALAELARNPVDIVLLDLEMPGMGGLEALPRILSAHQRLPVLVVSSLTEHGAEHTLAALAMGAADTMLKPRSGQFDQTYRIALLERIRALATPARAPARAGNPPAPQPAARTVKPGRPALIAIGASTGGIHAMGLLLRALPRQVTLPILVVQHLPASFSAVFARQLQLASGRTALVASDGMAVEPGHIYIAGGESHLVVRQSGNQLVLASQTGQAPSGCLPSVDPLFESLAACCGAQTLAVVLSGMGKDGLIGARALAGSGGRIVVQDQPSSAVWGMPRAIAEDGLAEAVLPPEQLARHIARSCGVAA